MSQRVTAPDGTEWKVGREWVPARPRLRRKDRKDRKDSEDASDSGAVSSDLPAIESRGSGWDLPSFADEAIVIGLVVGAVVLVVLLVTTVVLPALVLVIELIVLLVLLVAGLFGRVVLRRPWTVRARAGDGREEQWQVSGFRRSGELRDTVAESLRTTGGTDARLPGAAPA